MERRSFYNEILTEHNLRPEFKHDLPTRTSRWRV